MSRISEARTLLREHANLLRTNALLPLVACVLLMGVAGCQKNIRLEVPSGLAADEAQRLVKAVELAAEADRERDPERAAEKYRQAVTTYRELHSAWNNLGVLLMNQEKYLQAAEAFNTAAQLSSSDARPLYNLALLWDRRGYIREARQFYAQAINRDPSFLPALRGGVRADSLLQEGSTETLEWLQRALMQEQDPRWQRWLRLQKARIETLPSVKYQSEL